MFGQPQMQSTTQMHTNLAERKLKSKTSAIPYFS